MPPRKTVSLPADLVDRLHAYARSHNQTVEDALASLLSDAQDRDITDLRRGRQELSHAKREFSRKLGGRLPP